MYISGIEIKNFRSFDNINIDFHEGVNVLIGHNNSGKSNLLRALAIIFDRTVKKQLSVEDFNNSLTIDSLKKQSPKIVITVRIKQSENEDLMTDELITVSNWLTKLEEPYEAKIQYEFFLPISEEKNYVDTVNKANNKEEIWNIIRSQFIRLYISKIWGGNPENQVPIDNDNLNKFDFQFLDATKSNMLFAEKIIFVEGLAEQLLLNIFAEYLGKSLEKNHVAVINVGGRYFEHFLHLFDSNNKGAIDRKVSCITDLDPVRKCKTKNNYKACYPFEYNMNLEEFDYSTNDLLNEYEDEKHNNIRAFVQSKKYGKTFEYQLILDNPSLKLLLTESIANKKELIELMNLYSSNATFSELINTLSNSHENNRIKESLKNTNIDWNEEQKKKALIASRYLNSVGKGENALELASVLKDNLELKNQDEYQEFIVPEYIANAIEWVCE